MFCRRRLRPGCEVSGLLRYVVSGMLSYLLAIGCAVPVFASQPWAKAPEKWTAADVDRILSGSPWVQAVSVSFPTPEEERPAAPLPGPAQAGMAGGNASGSHSWDGGVGRNDRGWVPSLSVVIRWDSALPIQLAHRKVQRNDSFSSYANPELAAKYYVLTIAGLVPARAYRAKATPNNVSVSDDTVDARNPESMLEGFMSSSKLQGGGESLAPADVKLDASNGEVHLFFPRSPAIDSNTKEVRFTTSFGSLQVMKIFRLREMMFRGKVEL
jgi:hypothetical protein